MHRGRLARSRAIGHTFSMRRWLVASSIVVAAIAACDRERVEVANEAEDAGVASDAQETGPGPVFPMDAGAIDAGCAKDPLPVGVCGATCPLGFKIVDGKPTCDCCE